MLGVLVYNASDVQGRTSTAKLSDVDVIAVALFLTSVVPLLLGLSLVGSLYRWSDWQVIVPIASGGFFLLLLIGKEVIPFGDRLPFRSGGASTKPLLGLKLLRGLHGVTTFGGALFLGILVSRLPDLTDTLPDRVQMYGLLFFLPIYYMVIKEHSALATGLFLLPQTLMMAPCAGVVLVLVRVFSLSHHWTVLLSWLCTTCGIGLLALLGADRSATSDVLLNLLSGFGIGALLPALALSARDCTKHTDTREAPMVLLFMRYLGSASGLVIVGLVFQRVLRHNLGSTKFWNEADEMTKYATTLMYSIREMSTSQDKQILIGATEKTLRTIWLALATGSFVALLLNCIIAVKSLRQTRSSRNEAPRPITEDASQRPPVLETADLELDYLRVKEGYLKAYL